MQVVVVEDSPELARIIERALTEDGMTVHLASEAETGLELVRQVNADLVVLDINLPGIDGVEGCRRLRTFSDAYVVMLSGRDSEVDRLVGLSVGADDYMTKPFFARELVARVHAMQRRPRTSLPRDVVHIFGPLRIDPVAREVSLDGQPVELSRLEFELLGTLAASPRVSFSRTQLLERIWGPDWFGDDHVVDVHVSNLRRKLGDNPSQPSFIRTVRGHGYRMGTGAAGDG